VEESIFVGFGNGALLKFYFDIQAMIVVGGTTILYLECKYVLRLFQ